MKDHLVKESELHPDGIIGVVKIESSVNICNLAGSVIGLGLREGETSIVHNLTIGGAEHLISLLKLAVHNAKNNAPSDSEGRS